MDTQITRRGLLRDAGVAAGALALLGGQVHAEQRAPMAGPKPAKAAAQGPYRLPPLPYAYDALAPYIDARTLRLHHDKHHAGYVKGLNAALGKLAAARAAGDVSMAKYWAGDVAFNASGDVLHSLYWENMSPQGGGAPAGPIGEMIRAQYGSVGAFTDEFVAVSVSVPGSGWGVLAYEPMGPSLLISGVQKHENVDVSGSRPVLGSV